MPWGNAWWILIVLVSLLGILVGGCQSHSIPHGQLVKVAQVVSGQSLSIFSPGQITPSAMTERVALIGVVAPAWKQAPWDTQAKQQLTQWIGTEKTVLLEMDIQQQIWRRDGSPLKLAYLWKGDRLLNEQLIEAGLALAEVRSPNLKYAQRLLHAQEKARLLGRGIWNPQHPMRQTPEEFRRLVSLATAIP